MKQIKLLTVLLACAVFAAPAVVNSAGPPGGVDVAVVNTPLPVQGDVNVSGAVNATVVNTPLPVSGNVNVSGGVDVNNTPLPVSGTVNIGNEPLSVTVEPVVRIPFQYQASVDDWTGRVNFGIPLPSTADRLVIEHISAKLVIAPGSMLQTFQLDIQTPPLDPATHYISVPQSISTDSNGNDIYTVSQPLRLYTDGSFGVFLSLIKNPPTCTGFPTECDAAIAISGYIIPTTSASLGP